MAAAAANPISAIAQAIGSGFDMVKVGIGTVGNIISGRDATYRENNAYRDAAAQREYATNAQRLAYLQGSQSQSTKTLLIISAALCAIVIAFAILHKKRT